MIVVSISTCVDAFSQFQFLHLMANLQAIRCHRWICRNGNTWLSLPSCHGMSLRNIQRRGITSMTIMTIDTLERMNIFGETLARNMQPKLLTLPETGSP